MDKITLFHGFRKQSDATIVNGKIPVSCRGEGAGGQSDGFYIWNNKEKTVDYLKGYKCENPVICEIEVSANDIKYPDWQLDYEALGVIPDRDEEKQRTLRNKLAGLFSKHLPEVPNYKDDLRQAEKGFEVRIIKENKWGTAIKVAPNGSSSLIGLYEGNLSVSGCEQTLNDYMCKHSAGYRKEYNELMKESLSCFNGALKYTGKHELNVSALYDEKGEHNLQLEAQLLGKNDSNSNTRRQLQYMRVQKKLHDR